ncbi:MAG TPA: hypothetical protein VG755_12990 [Nannocystaceae bacterium]|nr:hypothetical protein [Nannocystaceae bacterium]
MGRHTIFATLLAGCGVKTVGDLDSGSDSSDSTAEGSEGHTSVVSQSASDSDTDSATGEESSASVSTTDPSTSTTDPTDTETDSGECPPGEGSICDPQPEIPGSAAAWSIDSGKTFQAALTDVQCVVADFQDDGTAMTIELHCDEEELAAHTIVVPSNPITPLNLGIDSSVRLSYYADTPMWTNDWFAIHRVGGGLIIGGSSGDSVLPPDNALIFGSIGLAVRTDVCAQECLIDECGPRARHAIDVTVDGDEATVFDRTVGIVGDPTQYTVVVGAAAGFVGPVECVDTPDAWYQVIVYDSSEG